MDVSDLPMGKDVGELALPHWPTRFQAFVARNWELVETAALAELLGTDAATVEGLARDVGLRVPAVVYPDWRERGYVTLIRRNWHLLPYEQLLALLQWTPEKLAYTLREDDFLWIKLGACKPRCAPLAYRDLTADETAATAQVRAVMAEHFPEIQATDEERPFGFLTDLPAGAGQGSGSRKPFGLRLAYAYAALYGDALLEPELDPYPEVHLAHLRDCGVNGVWLPAVLYTLYPWPAAGALSEGWERRLASLRDLVAKAREYGIGLYLYLNEPRGMDRAFFERNADWQGGAWHEETELRSLCTSNRETLDYLRDGVRFVFEQVSGLAGVFTISMSENLTHCHSRPGAEMATCPRCEERDTAEIVAEVNNVIEGAVHAVDPDARVLLYTWAWEDEWVEQVLDALSKNVEIMCVSEWGKAIEVGGVANKVIDYSISQVGPSEPSRRWWELARQRGMKTVAKVQLNCSWECSAVPWLPTPGLVDEHLNNLQAAGVDGLMISWTVGGYPGGNLRLLDLTLDEWGEEMFGDAWEEGRKACEVLDRAFVEFPFDVYTVYSGPTNPGPMNLLCHEPSGYAATMVCYAYDDLESWRAVYPAEVFEEQFRKLSAQWREGLAMLEDVTGNVTADRRAAVEEFVRMARATYCHFRSTYLQIAFVQRRDDGQQQEQLQAILDEEIQLAKMMEALVRADCRLGFEASNHYMYTAGDLREKVLNCAYLKTV